MNDRKVDFVICGTQKGGTSALARYLREHPSVCMSTRKEVHFFDTESHFVGGTPNYSLYHAAFEPQSGDKIIGEATPNYMYWYNAPRRMWEYNPGMKLIVVLRNPIERAYSHWNMEKNRRTECLSFWNALHSEKDRCQKVFPYQHRLYSYVDRGFYLTQLQRLWTYFPRKQTIILKNEDLRRQPNETLQRVFNFLGLEPFEAIQIKDVHSLPYETHMSLKERTYLENIYEQEIWKLEQELNWDCRQWLLH